VVGLVGAIAFILICYALLKRREKEQKDKKTVVEFLMPYGIAGGVACLLLAFTALF
jgi:predicted MFS family arabinose efflux permease